MRFSGRVINGLSRREFLIMTSLAATSLAAGCATNPVTGKSQFMIMDEKQEIAVDRQQSPHQFSADYGNTQDRALQSYVQTTGKRLTGNTHRGQMPYNFHCVNANYVNAYAFPGGSIACTRGILLELDNEAELAALLGHELGHVNARHTAEIMSKAQLANMAVGGLTILTSVAVGSGAGSLAGQLGELGSGALLATYSRDNERQADDLGMVYMTRSGYGPQGMVGLMEMLNSMNRHPAGMTDLLFATHPMSSERYQTSVNHATNEYRQYSGQPLYRERYMDNTAGLRKIKGAIKKMQEGEEAMGKEQYSQAEGLFKQALDEAPNDYAGLSAHGQVPAGSEKRQRGGALCGPGQAGLSRRGPGIPHQRYYQDPQQKVRRRLRGFQHLRTASPGKSQYGVFQRAGFGRRRENRTGRSSLQHVSEAGPAGKAGPVCVSAAERVGLHQIGTDS